MDTKTYRIRVVVLLTLALSLTCAVWHQRRKARLDGLGERLQDAVRGGDVETVRHLLETGAQPDRRPKYGYTALWVVIYTDGDPEMIPLLAAHGADVDAIVGTGEAWMFTPLTFVAPLRRPDVVDALLESGADPNKRMAGGRRLTPLQMAAAMTGNVAVVRLLLQHGAEVNPKGVTATPLERAMISGDTNIITLLIECGATTNMPYRTVPLP